MTAMNGVLLFGWSTAVMFEVLRRTMEPTRCPRSTRHRRVIDFDNPAPSAGAFFLQPVTVFFPRAFRCSPDVAWRHASLGLRHGPEPEGSARADQPSTQRSLRHGQTDHSRDKARRPATRRSHGDEFATTKETMMRTTFTAVLVACLGLIAVSATASAQWRASYVSYYGGGTMAGTMAARTFTAPTGSIARARISAAADTELSDVAPDRRPPLPVRPASSRLLLPPAAPLYEEEKYWERRAQLCPAGPEATGRR